MVRIGNGRIEAGRGPLEGADVIFAGPAPAIAAAVYAERPLDALIGAKALKLEGDRAVADRFVMLFPLPSKGNAR